jgi:N-acetyl-anhydromuramyl-L-alanine amidase AmpD
MAYSLSWLADVLEAAGLKVAEQPGWLDRGIGDMGAVKGVICHHTGGGPNGNMPSLGVITNGRPGLKGPLAQLGLGRDGTYYVVAAGRAQHAGKGLWGGVSTGNSCFIGIEAENTGKEPYPDVQMEAYVRGVAAILRKLGATEAMCCGHKEYALPKGRKPDPAFDMDAFRARVKAVMDGAAPPAPLIPAMDAKKRPTLRRGHKGDAVVELQKLLAAAGLGVGADGVFGPRTEAAVREFQRKAGTTPDGIVGPKTWAALKK